MELIQLKLNSVLVTYPDGSGGQAVLVQEADGALFRLTADQPSGKPLRSRREATHELSKNGIRSVAAESQKPYPEVARERAWLFPELAVLPRPSSPRRHELRRFVMLT